jgi:hypothetical protein
MVRPAIITAMMLFLAIFGTACDNFKPMYFTNVSSPAPFDASEKEKYSLNFEGSKEPSKEQMEICNEVIEQVSQQYSFDKPKPKIRVLPNKKFNRTASIKGTAVYDSIQKIIFIPESFNSSGKSYFCHELFHYISDCNTSEDLVGLEYFLKSDTDVYLFGSALNEGITNYFSTKVYNHPKKDCIYEFETHVASLLALSFGEDALWEAYTTGNWKKVKDAFNEACKSYPRDSFDTIRLTPFEQMEIALDEYQFLLYNIEDFVQNFSVEAFLDEFNHHVCSIDEMLLHYADMQNQKGKAKNKIKNFIIGSSERIDFSVLDCLL